jgi:hypothetical protein
MEQLLLKFLRPGSTVGWGLTILFSAFEIASSAEPTSPFYERHAFALAFASWACAVVLALRVHFRRHGAPRRSFFG